MSFDLTDRDVSTMVLEMSDEEKVDLLSGSGLWHTTINYRLNIPETTMTDGTYGVRYSEAQIDHRDEQGTGLKQFLELLNRRPNEGDTEPFGTTKPATCFPNGSCIACSWDGELLYQLGAALAHECHSLGVNLLLGPGTNIRRTPLAGRSYEYFSEDPVVSGELSAQVILGLQDNGVGASLKHFACNNSEIERTTMSSDVDMRALREIYLAGFERAIDKGRPWTVMSSYNRINGVQAANNRWLLTEVLREEWGYNGLVVSDWYAIKDRPASLLAGNDLDMPESPKRKGSLLAAIKGGTVPEDIVNASCRRMLKYISLAKMAERRGVKIDFDEHHKIAQHMASESIVLLKNDLRTLPLVGDCARKILVVGKGAVNPTIQGSGSATTRPTRVDIPMDELRLVFPAGTSLTYCQGIGEGSGTNEELIRSAADSDSVIVFACTDIQSDGEGADRTHLNLADGFDTLISALAKLPCRVIVVVTSPDAVEMPWAQDVDAILATFFPGQGGGQAIASILVGQTNPSGKLTVSFPLRLEDVPAFHTYPGENGRHLYAEGIFVGYRSYDLRKMQVRFPFGHGLSYTSFKYSELTADRKKVVCGEPVTLTFSVTNTGQVPGKEIVQVYIRPVGPGLKRPVRELKGFRKVSLEVGETRSLSVQLDTRDFQYFDTAVDRWVLRSDAFVVEIAASSRDVRGEIYLDCESDKGSFPMIYADTQPAIIARDPAAQEFILNFLEHQLNIERPEAETIFGHCTDSFLGLADTLNWFLGDAVDEDAVVQAISQLNAKRGFSGLN
ncbi:beta-glucosidase [Mesorhizobium sp. 10J20-29]